MKDTKSETIRDYLLGYIVTHFVQKRFDLAKEIAFGAGRIERPKNILYLGIMTMAGFNVERSKEKGLSEVRRAAALGDLEAQYYYARYAWPGQRGGKMPNDKTLDAYRYMAIAANRGHRSALLSVDLMIFNQSPYMPAQLGPEWPAQLEHDWRRSVLYRNKFMETISCALTDETRFQLLYHKILPACAP